MKKKLFFGAAILLLAGAGAFAAKQATISGEVYTNDGSGSGYIFYKNVTDLPCHQDPETCTVIVNSVATPAYLYVSGSYFTLGQD